MKKFSLRLVCMLAVVVCLCNGAVSEATRLERYHDLLASKHYTLFYTSTLISKYILTPTHTRTSGKVVSENGMDKYVLENNMLKGNKVPATVPLSENKTIGGEVEKLISDLDCGTQWGGQLSDEKNIYQFYAKFCPNKKAEYIGEMGKSGITLYPPPLTAQMAELGSMNYDMPILCIYDLHREDTFFHLKYVGDGMTANGMNYEDYLMVSNINGQFTEDGSPIRFYFSGDELKQIKLRQGGDINPLTGEVTEIMDNTIDIIMFDDYVDDNIFNLPSTQKIHKLQGYKYE